jgi:hypothetical protein
MEAVDQDLEKVAMVERLELRGFTKVLKYLNENRIEQRFSTSKMSINVNEV